MTNFARPLNLPDDILSPAGTGGRAPVLMYHRVGMAKGDWEARYCIAPARFRAHLAALSDAGYAALSLEQFARWRSGDERVPERSVLISFDDGFMGVYEHAAPALQEAGWPAVMFIVSALIGGHDEWSRAEHPHGATYPLLGWREIAAMRASGWAFGSHSRTHADLTTLDDAALADQLARSKTELEDGLGEPVDAMAYPYGRFDARVAQAARTAGYALGFSTRSGFNRRGEDAHALRRIDVFGTDTAAQLLRKVRLGTNDGSLGHLVGYYARQAGARLGLTSPDGGRQ